MNYVVTNWNAEIPSFFHVVMTANELDRVSTFFQKLTKYNGMNLIRTPMVTNNPIISLLMWPRAKQKYLTN